MVYSNIFSQAREAYEAWRDLSDENAKHLPVWWQLNERTRACLAFITSAALGLKEKLEEKEDEDVKALIKRLEDKSKENA